MFLSLQDFLLPWRCGLATCHRRNYHSGWNAVFPMSAQAQPSEKQCSICKGSFSLFQCWLFISFDSFLETTVSRIFLSPKENQSSLFLKQLQLCYDKARSQGFVFLSFLVWCLVLFMRHASGKHQIKIQSVSHYIDSEDNAFLHTHLKSVYVCNNICLSPHCMQNSVHHLFKCTGKGIKHFKLNFISSKTENQHWNRYNYMYPDADVYN